MAERNLSSLGMISRNYLFFLFSITSILFLISCLFVLRSTRHPHPVDRNSVQWNQYETKQSKCNHDNAKNDVLKVFMYDMPPEFHFGLLDWKPEGSSVWPDVRMEIPSYPGGLNLQHSIEYWLTLDLLLSEFNEPSNGHIARRVRNSSDADVIFIPFFSSLSYNLFTRTKQQEKKSHDKVLQDKLIKYLQVQEAWKRYGGVDHIIMAHHPNSLLYARNQLWPAMFILSDFGRYPPNVANNQKDVIAPYKHVIRSCVNDSSTFESRPTLLYFQGAIYRKDGGLIRQELFYLLKDEKDVHFAFGSIQRNGINNATKGMQSSKFCLNIAGDTPSSNRLFDAIASHCIPVIISDDIELPFEDVLDYSEFCVFVRTSNAIKDKYLINLIRGIGRDEWTRMWKRLQEVGKFFEFHFPAIEDDAVEMIWKSIARKVPTLKFKKNRSKRYFHTLDSHGKKEMPSFVVPHNFW